MTSTLAAAEAVTAAVTVLRAMDAESSAFHAENDRVREMVEAIYRTPCTTAAEKAALAALALAYDADAIEPAVALALRSIAA